MKYYSLKKNFFKRVMVMTAMLLVPLFVSAKSLIVKTVADLSELRTDLYEDVSIGADLDFSGIGNWEPIECTKLRIHGNGHTFRNIRSTGSTFGGLFSKVNILRVDSLTILNPIITDFSHSGAFAGWVGSAEFNSCFVNKTAESRITASTYAGGFVGRVSSSVSFNYCGSNMLVNGAKRAGGFVGDCMVEYKFNHCYCNSEVRSSVLSAGFLCGSVSGINSINNCFMGGDVANGYAFVPYTNNSQSDSDFLKNCICEYGRAQYDNTSIGAQLFDYRSIVSGRACWQLNHENYPELEASCVWKQTIGEDVTPMFDGKTVYKKKDGTFSNIDNDVEKTYDLKGFCVEDGSFEKPASKNGSYLIKNYGNLMWFAKEVNAGNSRISAILVNDISCLMFNRKVDWVPIGASPATPYAGSFDGAGYTIESLDTKEGNYQGLFGFLKNAAVSNLNLEGAIVWSNSYAGAIAGYAESSSILNCKVQCQLYAQKYSGGAVGYAKSSTFEKVDVSTQAYALHVFDSDNKNCGFVGYAEMCSFNACLNRLRNFGVLNGGSLTNSLSIGSSWTAGTSIPTIDNSYYIVSVATSAYEQTDAQLCSGEVCYKLNKSSEADDVAWRQKVVVNAVNSYPCFTGPVVIKTTACDGTTIVFCNSDTKPNAHSFNRNGVCCVCNNAYQPADENGGCFEISNAGQLCWFSEYQENHQHDTHTRVILLNDILLGTYKKGQSEWKPIPMFMGVFDGQNHTIRGISVDKKSRAGFFDYLAGSAKVQNLILDQGEIRGSDEVGAFTATVSGSAQLINCVNRGIRVEAKNGRAGGLIGSISSANSNTYTIENCANFAPVSGNTCGGLASNRVKARGSFIYNTRQMELPLVGGNANNDIVRCFSLSSSDGNLGKTVEQFKSGEVCYLLNDASSENPVWKQMLQTDSVPSVLAKYIVYGVKGCNSTEEVEMLFYTNKEAEKDKAQYHSFNQYGLCTKCQTSYQEPLLVNSTYIVSNQGNLCWIAEHSNMVVGKVVLVYDIKLMPENYRMGQQQWNSFVCGFHFDGDGHSISGIDAPLVDSLKANGCITNLNLIDGAILSQDKYVGAFAAVAEGSVSKCVNASVVINGANSQFIGGIVGELNGDSASVAYCANMANVKGYGLVAKVTKGSVERSFCYSENTCVGSGASAASRCFYLLPDKETADGGRTANCFESGEVCYLLNDSLNEAVWKQDLSKDAIPSLTATQQVFGAFTCHENESERYRVYSNDSNLQDWEHNFADGVCTVCRAGLQEPEHDADGFYLIKKQSELLWFANYLNESSKKNVNARLGDDITLGKDFAWTPISEFSGEFDGNGKSISGLKVNGYVRNGAGFVALLDGGYIHDLTLKSGSVNAEVENPSQYQYFGVGAFVGYAANLAKIEKCVNEGVAVTASNIDAGGIVGYLATSSSITYCADFAAVNSSLHAGCIVGNAASGSVTSCFAYGVNNSLFGKVNEKSVEINNCYSTNNNDGSYYKPYDKFNNGEVCWLLNGSSSENPIWKQNLNSIVRYPVLSGNYVIYASKKCDGETHYTNNKQYSEIAHIDESKYYKPYGYCPTCNGMEPAYLNDGYYEISKPGHLYWFANMVNSSADKSVKAKLTADISCKDYYISMPDWTPIAEFSGTFDGNGKFISDLNCVESDKVENAGLVGVMKVGGTIKNLTIKKCQMYGMKNAGALVARMEGGSIGKCIVDNGDGSIVAGTNYGGIVGCLAKGSVSYCCYKAKNNVVPGKSGGTISLVGKAENGKIESTFVYCYELVIGGKVLKIVTDCASSVVQNANYTLDLNDDADRNVFSESAFRSGEVCWLLNSRGAKPVWQQNLRSDNTPNFKGGTVYGGYKCFNDILVYSNGLLNFSANADHSFADDGCCKYCGEKKAPVLENGWYVVRNYGEFYSVYEFIKGGQSVKVKLDCDIYITSEFSSHFGNLNFKGEFEGGNHTISGNMFTLFNQIEQGAVVSNLNLFDIGFAQTSYGTVKNITLDYGMLGHNLMDTNYGVIDNCVNKKSMNGSSYSYNHVGGIANSNYGTITNSSFIGDIKGVGGYYGNLYAGGITGYNAGTVSNCTFEGVLKSNADYLYIYGGGIVGENAADAVVVSCVNKGSVDANYAAGVVAFARGQIEDCRNEGAITGSNSAGGIVCVSSPDIANDVFVPCSVSRCSNKGSIVGAYYAGGLVASFERNKNTNNGDAPFCLNLKKSFNTGSVVGKVAGGLLGGGENTSIRDCYNRGEVKGGNFLVGNLYNYVGANGATTNEILNCMNAVVGAGACPILANDFLVYNMNNLRYDNTTYKNCHCLGTKEFDDNSGVVIHELDKFQSGYVCYELNNRGNGYWKQDIGIDSFPNFTSSVVVYDKGMYKNKVCIFINGFCACGELEPATIENGVYKIANAGQLLWMSDYVNHNSSKSIKMELTNNIKVGSEHPWTPMGVKDKPFGGEFDGMNHVVSELYTETGDVAGLFGYCEGGRSEMALNYFESQIRNVGVINSSFNVAQNGYVGAIAAHIGNFKVSNCYAVDNQAGADKVNLVGYCPSNGKLYVSDCFSDKGSSNLCDAKSVSANIKYNNSYYLGDVATNTPDGDVTLAARTAKQFVSGEVCCALNKDKDQPVWMQDLDIDRFPNFSSNKMVYSSSMTCNGNIYYSNEEIKQTTKDHIYDARGICACGAYQPAKLQVFKNTYQIGNLGQLYWLANDLRNALNPHTVNAELTDDIYFEDLNEGSNRAQFPKWEPLGFVSEINGNNHKIVGYGSASPITLVNKCIGVGINGTATSQIHNLGLEKNIILCDSTASVNADNLSTTGVVFKDCYAFDAPLARHFEGRMENCYTTSDKLYVKGEATVHNSYVYRNAARKFKSGEICVRLNGGNGSTWRQYLGTDNVPTFQGDLVDSITNGVRFYYINEYNPTLDTVELYDGKAFTGVGKNIKAKTVTFARGGESGKNWGTMCLPFKFEVAKCNAQLFSAELVDGVINLTQLSGTIMPGQPVIFYSANSSDITVKVDNVVIMDDTQKEGSLVGTFSNLIVTATGSEYYLKANTFKQGVDNFKVLPFRAYLEAFGSAKSLKLCRPGNEAESVLEEAEEEGETENEVSVVATYNLKGQRVGRLKSKSAYILKMSDGSSQKVFVR